MVETIKHNTYAMDLAWNIYCLIHSRWNDLSVREKPLARRQVEAMVREGGIRGKSTGLISEAALETLIALKKGEPIARGARIATEHPITYKVVSLYALGRDEPLGREEYEQLWLDALITTETTSDENQMLKNSQSVFSYGDCWKQMYEDAGVKLVSKPSFRTNAVKQQYGLI